MIRFGRNLSLGLAALGMALVLWTGDAHAQRTIRDTEIEELLRDYADPLFLAAGLNTQSVDLYVVNDPVLNAFVAGGQNMFINTGLILAADSPNELIGVIAHETGHISGGHNARTRDAITSIALPAYIGTAVGLALMAMGAPEAGMAVMFGGQHLAQQSFLAYSRAQEATTDQAAMNFLDATEQSGQGLLTFFDRFRDQEAMLAASRDPYIRTHPLNSERIGLLEQRVTSSPYFNATDSEESMHRFRMTQAKIRGFLSPERTVLAFYPLADTSAPARYARAVVYFRRGETDLALAEIDSLITEEPENPYFHELRGQVFFEAGRVAESLPSHRRSIELAPRAALLRINLGQALLASEEDNGNTSTNQEALRNLQFAIAYDNTSSFAWHELALAHARAGNEGLADLSVAEQYYTVRDLQMSRQFAFRARDKLTEGTVPWNRAMDILFLTDPERAQRGAH